MSRAMDTSQWIAFFMKSGLPANVAANYAIIFFDNRIQTDMLLDLSKEYLYDMGIKVMGDVIAILKYAREFHNQLAKERIIGGSQPVPKTKAVAERLVGHYTRSSPVRPSPVRQSMAARLAPVHQPMAARLAPARQPMAGRLAPAPLERATHRVSNVISLKKPPAFKKPRRVPPEEEGAYKIKMPQGTTERTRKIMQLQNLAILQKQQMPQGGKRSVFSRLGETAVSSSTDSNKVVIERLGSSSVFERLGPSSKGDETPTSTNEFAVARPKGKPLPYRGVLKMTVGKSRTVTTAMPKNANISARTVIKPIGFGDQCVIKSRQLSRINTVLHTNKSPNAANTSNVKKRIGGQGLFGKAIAAQGQNVMSRLGGKIDARNPARTKLLLKQRLQLKTQPNVFDRLGK